MPNGSSKSEVAELCRVLTEIVDRNRKPVEVITVDEVAALCRCSRVTILEHIRRRLLKAARAGHKYVVRVEEVERYLKRLESRL